MNAKYINSYLNRSKNQNGNMFLGLWQKGLFQVLNSILHKHFGLCKSFIISDLSNWILSKSRIAWNITINNDYNRFWISWKDESDIYKFKIKSFKEPKWKYVFHFMTKRTISVSKLIISQTYCSMCVF